MKQFCAHYIENGVKWSVTFVAACWADAEQFCEGSGFILDGELTAELAWPFRSGADADALAAAMNAAERATKH